MFFAREVLSRFAALAALTLAFSACGSHSLDPSDPVDKQGIIDATNNALNSGDCLTALNTILPLYNSAYTDNTVRMVAASAYGCHAHINFINVINALSSAPNLGGSGFFEFAQQTFLSTLGQDKVVEGAGLGTDALMAVMTPGQVIVPQFEINIATPNPGSLIVTDRIQDSNMYLMMMSLALIGGVESRDGAPLANHHKGAPMPWTQSDASGMNADGCAYASALLNFGDALKTTLNAIAGNAQSAFQQISTGFVQTLDQACAIGCQNIPVPNGTPLLNPSGVWPTDNCTAAVPCTNATGCPISLRNRNSCTQLTSDVNSCAAAGIVNFVNNSSVGWQGPP